MKGHRILVGDCVEMMRTLPDQSVHTCITSPPYFGLRDYGVDGQIGLEPTPDEFVQALVVVFREVRRVLRDDGTLWLNLGDSYATDSKWGGSTGGKATSGLHGAGGGGRNKTKTGIPDKNLIGIPWRVAFALQSDGWYLRQDIIWSKPNPMPESVRDRCTKAHEYIFLLSKSSRYYFDSDAIKEPAAGLNNYPPQGAQVPGAPLQSRLRPSKKRGEFNGKTEAMATTGRNAFRACTPTRNRRSVWTIAIRPFHGAHFATFPPDLVRPCVIAGSPPGGQVLDPFGGSGTTGVVAMQEGRQSILCELNPKYAQMARSRLEAARFDGATQLDAFRDTAPHMEFESAQLDLGRLTSQDNEPGRRSNSAPAQRHGQSDLSYIVRTYF